MDKLIEFVADGLGELWVDVLDDYNKEDGEFIYIGENRKFSFYFLYVDGCYNIQIIHGDDFNPDKINDGIIKIDIGAPDFDIMDVVWLGYLVHVANLEYVVHVE